MQPERTHTLYLLRHGESEMNVCQPVQVCGRSRWCELTAEGVRQARRLGARLRDEQAPCDRVVASTAVRAQQTARYALEAAGIPLRRLQTSPLLEEQCQGTWENELREAIYTPEVKARVAAAHWDFRPPEGESFADVFARVHGWLEAEVFCRPPPSATWIFCHGGVIRALLTGTLGLEPADAWRIPIDNASITILQYGDGGGWTEVCRNRMP